VVLIGEKIFRRQVISGENELFSRWIKVELGLLDIRE
jgi:hypothetical protein